RGRMVEREDLRALHALGAVPVHPVTVAGIEPATMPVEVSKLRAAHEAPGRIAFAGGVGNLELVGPSVGGGQQGDGGKDDAHHYWGFHCAAVGLSLRVVVRRTSRTMLRSSKRRTRCIVVRLSQITRSNGCHLCT